MHGIIENWTGNRIEVVRTLVQQGLTAREISERLGVSRGAVCGLIFRHAMRPKREKKQAEPAIEKVQPPKEAKSAPRARRRKKDEASPPKPQIPAAALAPQPFKPREAIGVTPRLIPLAELSLGDCCYPYGDSDYRFCGCPSEFGKSYCPPHLRLAAA